MPYKLVEFGTIEGILGCVTAGLGVAMFPHSVIRNLNYSDKVAIHKIPETFSLVSTMFIRNKNVESTKAVDAFLRIIREEG